MVRFLTETLRRMAMPSNRPTFFRDRFRTLLFGLTEGVLVAALVVNVRDAAREDAFFRKIAADAIANRESREDQLVALVHKTYSMIAPLEKAIEDHTVEDVTGLSSYHRVLMDSTVTSVLYPNSHCGSYSGVLVKLLEAAGFPVRFVQMLDREEVTGVAHHILAEAWVDGRWVICDARYDLVFRDDQGRLLGFDDIKRDWDKLKSQCPPNYDMRYDFRGVRRVNFGKLNPWLQKTPLANVSIRTWLNDGAWFRSMLVAGLMLLVAAVHVMYERSLRQRATSPNVVPLAIGPGEPASGQPTAGNTAASQTPAAKTGTYAGKSV